MVFIKCSLDLRFNHDPGGMGRKFPCYSTLLLLALCISSCARVELTSITAAPTGVHNPGQIVWHDLITDDIATAREFYGSLLGWEFEKYQNYVLVRNGSRPIAGMVQLKDESEVRRSSGWIPYFSILDVEDTASWIQSVGGKILMGPGEMVNRGHYATVTDPLGAPIVVLRAKGGDPKEKETRLGDWLWDELWTSDVEKALGFYQSLGDFAAERIGGDGTTVYWALQDNQDQYQAGITAVPFEGLPNQWVPVIRVEEPMDIAIRAGVLGGTVIVDPDHPMSDGHIALIKDPVGGIFIVEKWEIEN